MVLVNDISIPVDLTQYFVAERLPPDTDSDHLP